MADEKKGVDRDARDADAPRQVNNLTEFREVGAELDPETSPDPLTDHVSRAQAPTADEDIVALPETQDGIRTGDFDRTTGAAHPTADSGADKGVNG